MTPTSHPGPTANTTRTNRNATFLQPLQPNRHPGQASLTWPSAPQPNRDIGADRDAESRERGSVTAELVLLTPLLILLLLLVVALGRLTSARLQVDSAASQAARAASLARDPTTAATLAQQTATGTLTGQHHTCTGLAVTTDTSRFQAGGWVAVTVRCTVSLSDLGGLRLPTTESVTARFVEPLDTYRATTP